MPSPLNRKGKASNMGYEKKLTDCKRVYLENKPMSLFANARERTCLIEHTRRDFLSLYEVYVENTEGGFFVIEEEWLFITVDAKWVTPPSYFRVEETMVIPWFGYDHRTKLVKAMQLVEQEVLMKEKVML